MLLYYHSYFDMLYAGLLIPGGIFKLLISDVEAMMVVSLILTIFYIVTETFRLNFGFTGNINESFPELIAFLI